MNFCFGSDPEFMVLKNDELKSAIGVLRKNERRREAPKKKLKTNKDGHRFYYDNVLAEIALKPANSKVETLDNVRSALHGLAAELNPCRFVIRASANYPKRELNCEQARIAGCEAEWDVYKLQYVYPPDSDVEMVDGHYQFKTTFRTAGGHIHLGSYDLQNESAVFNMIRMMDLFIGVPSIFMDTDPTSKDRRTVYGQAGTHRVPEYGLEYRTLGNFWFSSPQHVGLIYDLCEFVFDFVQKGKHERFWLVDEDMLDADDPSEAFTCVGYDVKMLQRGINKCDKSIAEKFMWFVESYLPTGLQAEINKLVGKPLPCPYETWKLNV